MQINLSEFIRKNQPTIATRATMRVFQKAGIRRSIKTIAMKFMIGKAG